MKKLRDLIRLIVSILFFWLYIPHFIIYLFMDKRCIDADLDRYKIKVNISPGKYLLLLYLLHNNWAFRTLFYYRIGAIASFFIGWWRPKDRYFDISFTTKIGPGAYIAHPRATGINANSIGKNFSCRQLTTIGNKKDGDNKNRPIIGDNVTLGANVTIIGPIRVGNNVTIGAGSVVVKDIPDNCVAVGNPCKPIKFLDPDNKSAL